MRSEQLIHIIVFAALGASNNGLIYYMAVFFHCGAFMVTVFLHLLIPNQRQDSLIFTVMTEGTTYITNPLEATFSANGSKLVVDIFHEKYNKCLFLFSAMGGLIRPIKKRIYTIKFFLDLESI